MNRRELFRSALTVLTGATATMLGAMFGKEKATEIVSVVPVTQTLQDMGVIATGAKKDDDVLALMMDIDGVEWMIKPVRSFCLKSVQTKDGKWFPVEPEGQ